MYKTTLNTNSLLLRVWASHYNNNIMNYEYKKVCIVYTLYFTRVTSSVIYP